MTRYTIQAVFDQAMKAQRFGLTVLDGLPYAPSSTMGRWWLLVYKLASEAKA